MCTLVVSNCLSLMSDDLHFQMHLKICSVHSSNCSLLVDYWWDFWPPNALEKYCSWIWNAPPGSNDSKMATLFGFLTCLIRRVEKLIIFFTKKNPWKLIFFSLINYYWFGYRFWRYQKVYGIYYSYLSLWVGS